MSHTKLNNSLLFFSHTGSTSVRTAVLKDGHTFLVHVVDPKVEGEDQPEDPTPPPTPTPRSTVDESEEKQDTER